MEKGGKLWETMEGARSEREGGEGRCDCSEADCEVDVDDKAYESTSLEKGARACGHEDGSKGTSNIPSIPIPTNGTAIDGLGSKSTTSTPHSTSPKEGL